MELGEVKELGEILKSSQGSCKRKMLIPAASEKELANLGEASEEVFKFSPVPSKYNTSHNRNWRGACRPNRTSGNRNSQL